MTAGQLVQPHHIEALVRLRADAWALADVLLELSPELGERRLQRLVDGYVEQACDTLRALAECAQDALNAGIGGP